MKKFLFLLSLMIVLTIAGTIYWRYYFVFGQGVKAGNLNFLVYKGYVFKTWEGRLIQSGFKTKNPGAIQSNEFDFSVANDSIARILELNSGKEIEVRYNEYLHPLPWRGMSNYVVTEIISIAE
ncbi:hypothetical protein LX69_00160 [Breznakibacter xylanolyticus]|uniref:6-phosphogluconate dehydrogenase n=1 Tax=Breznakibacter xylanolyticus TaxID=990 RepID=A0A2W7NJX8_9BACT|nr:hypothetical protein [Breznakibacter xylanolyticus]PZX20735.1 hypothetical protein LX69_00160 [Breznakibacter xylanolyticus]